MHANLHATTEDGQPKVWGGLHDKRPRVFAVISYPHDQLSLHLDGPDAIRDLAAKFYDLARELEGKLNRVAVALASTI